MAARQTNRRSSSNQTSTSKNKHTQNKSGNGSNKRSTSSKYPKMTKEEIAEQSAFHDEIILVVTLVVSVLLLLANFNMGGFVGSAVSTFLKGIFGTLTYIIPIVSFVAVAFHISNRGNWKATKKIITSIVFIVALMAFFQMLTNQYQLNLFEFYKYGVDHKFSGGIIGGLLCMLLTPLFGTVGTYVILIAIFLICFMMLTGKTIITALSQRGEKSLVEMRDRYRESASYREEYRQQSLQENNKKNNED